MGHHDDLGVALSYHVIAQSVCAIRTTRPDVTELRAQRLLFGRKCDTQLYPSYRYSGFIARRKRMDACDFTSGKRDRDR